MSDSRVSHFDFELTISLSRFFARKFERERGREIERDRVFSESSQFRARSLCN